MSFSRSGSLGKQQKTHSSVGTKKRLSAPRWRIGDFIRTFIFWHCPYPEFLHASLSPTFSNQHLGLFLPSSQANSLVFDDTFSEFSASDALLCVICQIFGVKKCSFTFLLLAGSFCPESPAIIISRFPRLLPIFLIRLSPRLTTALAFSPTLP